MINVATNPSLGHMIQTARIAATLTQSELVERIQKSITTISRYENSKTYPNSDSLRDLAEVLEVTVAYLLGDEVHSDARLL